MPQPDSEASREVTRRVLQVIDYLVKNHAKVRTKKDFCEAIGLHRAMPAKWMQETGNVTTENLVNLVKVFNVSPYFLLAGSGEMFQEEAEVSILKEFENRLLELEKIVNVSHGTKTRNKAPKTVKNGTNLKK